MYRAHLDFSDQRHDKGELSAKRGANNANSSRRVTFEALATFAVALGATDLICIALRVAGIH